MKIATNSTTYFELADNSVFTTIEVADDEEIIREFKELKERSEILQCKLEALFFSNIDKAA